MNFKTVQLSYVLQPVSTQIQPQDCADTEYVGLEHLSGGDLNLGEAGKASQVRSTKWSFKTGDVLYGKLRPYLNKCVVADREGICSTDILVLRPKENILPRYIAYQLISDDFVRYSNSTASGMNLPRTTWSKFNNYEIVVPFQNNEPDILAQQQIVQKLDDVFGKTRVVEAKEKENGRLLKSLFTSYLYSQFNNADIGQMELGDICNISGGFGFPHSYQGRNAEKYPFYKVSDMNLLGNEIYMKTHNHSISESDAKELKVKIYPAGTIIFPKIGAAIATNKKRILSVPATVDNNVMVLVPKENVSPAYIYTHLLNFNLSDWSSKAALPSIRKSVVQKTIIPIPLKEGGEPDFRIQEEFAEKISIFQEKVRQFQGLSESTISNSNILRQATLTHTFKSAGVVSEALLSPIQIKNISPVQQAIALVLRRFQRGEMVLAKVLYIGQSIFKVPLGIQFTQQSFGPYSTQIKTSVEDGLTKQKNLFIKKGTKSKEVLALNPSIDLLLNHFDVGIKKQMNDYLDAMMPHYFSSDSRSIELLGTICKIIEDEKTSDDVVIRQKLQEWKPNRFQDSETYRTISFIKKNKWDQKILQV